MSTEDDRTQGSYFTTGDSSATTQNFGTPSTDSSFFDEDNAYTSSAPTTTFGSGFDEVEDDTKSRTPEWHRGLDFGLLVLRLAVGGLFVAHGLDKLFGWFEGMGMQGTRDMLSSFQFTEPGLLAWVVALSETVGGLLVILGLFFPAGAAALLGVMVNVIVVRGDWNTFLGGVELEMTYAAVAFALLFTGPGRVAIDRHTHWWRKAPAYGFVFLIVAAGLSVVTLVVFR